MKRIIAAGLLALTLTACESSEERAQRHYEAAVALMTAGDPDRAVVELRNVFKLNGTHRDGRMLMGNILRERGDLKGAYGHYLRVVEQFPADPEALKALASLAFDSGDLREARVRVDAARQVLPDDTLLQAYGVALDYREARGADDTAAASRAAGAAAKLLAADPTLLPARQVVIGAQMQSLDLSAALSTIDAGLAIDETQMPLHAARLAVLDQLGDKAGIEAQLKRMIALFPDDESIGATLARWYVGEKRIDDAEEWVRAQIPQEGDDPEPRLRLVQFIAQLRGPEAAAEELDKLLAAQPPAADVAANLSRFRAVRAGFRFNTGKRDEGLAEMEELVRGITEPSDQDNQMKVALAQMRSATNNEVGARALVEEVLVSDPANAEALKLKGGWQIDDDQTDDAIATLRQALNTAPRDAQAMTLLARAYQRQGSRDLAGQMLAQAVEATNTAPEEALRYATFLLQDNKLQAAEDLIITALRLDNTNVRLLGMLAQIHVAMADWPRADADIARLREVGGEEGAALADEMQARKLAALGQSDELTAFLEGLTNSPDAGLGAEVAVIRAMVQAGRADEALARTRELAAAHPQDPTVKFLLGAMLAMSGSEDQAAVVLREVVAEAPKLQPAWTALYGVLMRQGDEAGANAVLAEALTALPDNGTLKMIKAGVLERQGDIEGAIAVYAELYERNSDLTVIANNLASLLASFDDDAEKLDRAWTVARRLKGTKVPAFADTYGWIAFRRGEVDEAVPYLELAAAGLPEDPEVQFHLASAYAAQKRHDEARAAFEAARARITDKMPGLPGLEDRISKGMAALEGG